ncbi:hypothetical protein [Adonisia turfae]|uniref:Mobilization protein n=1 Tax=Adonisia turfae CCMR0081 TaxID=2292702 RepID=A0A6M0RZA7_9CYAN|nr:hypothetical protein [Adonisia turfae]NEZ61042.1 hypothetical protein [Adonisia turfae CCMR0081]
MSKLAATLSLRQLIFVGGEKGGVGKSMFAKTLCANLIDRSEPYVLVECDRSNPDLLRTYGHLNPDGHKHVAVFSEGQKYEDSANNLFNLATEHRVVANLPAQVFNALRQWLVYNSIFELAAESKVKIYHFHISDSGYDSLALFSKYVKEFGNQLNHVFVKNLGLTDDWAPFHEDDELQALISQYQIPVISLPKFIGNKDRNLIDKLSLTFGEAREYDQFGAISRQRVKTFLSKAYAEFDRLDFLQPTPQIEDCVVPFVRPSRGGEDAI